MSATTSPAPVQQADAVAPIARDVQPALEPMPWPGMSKAECVLLAILLQRAARVREVGR